MKEWARRPKVRLELDQYHSPQAIVSVKHEEFLYVLTLPVYLL